MTIAIPVYINIYRVKAAYFTVLLRHYTFQADFYLHHRIVEALIERF
jgi:hypothetical protein